MEYRDDLLELKYILRADFRQSTTKDIGVDKSKKMIDKLKKLGIITSL